MRFALIDAEKAEFPVRTMCRVLDVSESGFFSWKGRPASQRQRDDMIYLAHIRIAFELSNRTYGSPRMHRDLVDEGLSIGRRRTARLMRENGLAARQKRRFKRTTDSTHAWPVAPNLLDQDFAATRRAACAGPRSRPTAPKASTASSATTSPPPAPPRPTAGPATPRPPSRPTIPTSSVPWPPTSCCPGSIRCSPISRAGRAASITGCAPSTCKAISTSSCSASTGAGHATPPSARCSASPCAPSPSPTTCWSGGSWCISDFLEYSIGVVHLRFQINFNEVTVLYATWRFAKSDSMIRISTTLKCRLKAATMPSESLLGIAGDISASTCTELYSGKWVHTTYSGCG